VIRGARVRLLEDSGAGTGMGWKGSPGGGNRHWLWLIPIGATSLLLYAWFFLKPYPLVAHYAVPLLDLGKLTGYSHAAARDYVLAFLLLFALSYAAYVLCRGSSSSFGLLVVLLFAFLCGLTLVLVYPITAADVFEYIAYARITVFHGLNPHVYRPMDFPDDPLMWYSAWPHITSPYGPVWTYLSAAIGALSGSSLLTYLLLFKGLALAVHVLNSALIYATLRRWSPSYALSGAVLYAWNPLVLYESAAGGHNDGLVVLFTLLAVYLFVRKQIALSIAAAALSCLVKMPMAIVVPLFVVGGWRAPGTKNSLASRALVGRAAITGVAGQAGPVHLVRGHAGGADLAAPAGRCGAGPGTGAQRGAGALRPVLLVPTGEAAGRHSRLRRGSLLDGLRLPLLCCTVVPALVRDMAGGGGGPRGLCGGGQADDALLLRGDLELRGLHLLPEVVLSLYGRGELPGHEPGLSAPRLWTASGIHCIPAGTGAAAPCPGGLASD
jgi:hypothetical protein